MSAAHVCTRMLMCVEGGDNTGCYPKEHHLGQDLPGDQQLGKAGWPVSTSDPPVSVSLGPELQACIAIFGIFTWFPGIELGFSYLQASTLPAKLSCQSQDLFVLTVTKDTS